MMKPIVQTLLFNLCLIVSLAASAAAPENVPVPHTITPDARLKPAHNPMKVAFVVSNGAQVIDMTGPWEVFQDVTVDGKSPFRLFTVSDSLKPVKLTGGLTVSPDYTFADAPAPDVVVVGAQGKFATPKGKAEAFAWLRKMHDESQVEMSVCVGAFTLAGAGLLDGKPATTHHQAFAAMRKFFPKVELVEDKRFVQSDSVIETSGGLTAGIDLALHVVERYYGNKVAKQTADYMEYRGDQWR